MTPRWKLTSLPVSSILVALAEEVDLGDDDAGLGVADPEAANVGEQPAATGIDLDLAADLPRHGNAGIGIGGKLGQAAADDLDLRAAADDLDDLADRLMVRDQSPRRRIVRDRVRIVVGHRKVVEVHGIRHRVSSPEVCSLRGEP